jgi:hypothetical protein
MKKLYKVTFINQETGNQIYNYVLAKNLQEIEDEYCDIIKIEPLTPFVEL